MDSKLFIPKKIKVGFQERDETYTGKLAYIIYFDEKNKLRKETSWLSWCDKDLGSFEFDNEPRNGYVFNKGVQRYAYHFGSGRSMLRVYDPRGFEFEITIDNLEAVLMNSDISKKEIMGEYVFAWSGSDLILLPTNSQEYIESVSYTEKQDKKISAKELIKGATYSRKKNDEHYIYIGHHEWFEDKRNDHVFTKNESKGKKHIFAYNDESEGYVFCPLTVNLLAECLNEEVDDNYADLVVQFENSFNYKLVNDFELVDLDDSYFKDKHQHFGEYHNFIRKEENNLFTQIGFHMSSNEDSIKVANSWCRRYEFRYYKFENGLFNHCVEAKYHYRDRKYVIDNSEIEKKIEAHLFNEKSELNFNDLMNKLKELGFKEFKSKNIDGVLYKT